MPSVGPKIAMIGTSKADGDPPEEEEAARRGKHPDLDDRSADRAPSKGSAQMHRAGRDADDSTRNQISTP